MTNQANDVKTCKKRLTNRRICGAPLWEINVKQDEAIVTGAASETGCYRHDKLEYLIALQLTDPKTLVNIIDQRRWPKVDDLLPDFCGCCGETKRECVCPDGPTDSYAYTMQRWARRRCSRCPLYDRKE